MAYIKKEKDLLPCPFCGSEAQSFSGTARDTHGERSQFYGIRCRMCGAKARTFTNAEAAPFMTGRQAARAAWNCRSSAGFPELDPVQEDQQTAAEDLPKDPEDQLQTMPPAESDPETDPKPGQDEGAPAAADSPEPALQDPAESNYMLNAWNAYNFT